MVTGHHYSMDKESKFNPLGSHHTINSHTASLRAPTSTMRGAFHGVGRENSPFPSLASSGRSHVQSTSDDFSRVRNDGGPGSRLPNQTGSPFISTFDPDPSEMNGNRSTSERLRPPSSQESRHMSIGSMSGLERPYGSS